MKKMHFVILAMAALCLFSCGKTAQEEQGGAPAAPANLKQHDATEASLTFQWDLVSQATSYSWTLLQSGTQQQKGTVTGRNVKVEGLSKATDYRFGVKAVNADGESDYAWLDARTGGEDTPVTPPGPSTVTYEDFAIPAYEEDGVARAFPGAEGGGMYATGGRGGAVLHVTNLNDKGEGSLRAAIEAKGARTIVFDVAGVIDLQSELRLKNGDVTIAGQTAPGDGICLKNYTFRISASNVIIRFIRCRMGDEKKNENDAIQIMEDDDKVNNIIIDHCSFSWSIDECASFYGMKDFTFQWNIVSESLRNSVHAKKAHGYGGIWGGTDASYHHNLLAHHDSRNPRIDHDYVSTQKGPLSLVNNVIYNWSGNTCYGGESKAGADFRKYNIVNNFYKPGPASKASNKIWFLDPTVSCSNCESADPSSVVPGHFYMTGNTMDGYSAMTDDNWTGTTAKAELIPTIKADTPFKYADHPTSISIHNAQKAFSAVVEYAGASFSRDAIDARIAKETKNGTSTYTGSNGSTNGLIDSQSDVGGWPEYKGDTSSAFPDWVGDPNAYTLDPQKRYTNLEMYLHYLVREIVSAQNANATYKQL